MSDWRADYDALRDGAGLAERTGWSVQRFTGEDCLGFLHKYITQEVRVDAGRGAYGCVLTVKGAMLGDLYVYVREGDLLAVMTEAARPGLTKHLKRFALFDKVTIADQGEAVRLLSVLGPKAAATVEAACGVAFPEGAPDLAHQTVDWRGHSLFVALDDCYGVGGLDLIVPAGGADALRAALQEAGAQPVRAEAELALRVEAGVPLYGVDMNDGTIPVEAGLEARAISYDKGCYTGQEVIARIAHRGKVNRRLTWFDVSAGTDAPVGLHNGAKEVGRLTSISPSPQSDGALLGLGIVHRKHGEPGNTLTAGEGGPAVSVRGVVAG